jgi:phage-related protein
MAGVDFYQAWVWGGTTNVFVDPYDLTEIEDTGLSYDIPEQSAPGTNGTYNDDSYARPRDLTITGTMVAGISGTPTDLRSRMDTLSSWFVEGAAGKFFWNSDRFINARVARFGPSKAYESPGMFQPWLLALHCADPFFYDAAAQSPVSLTPGSGLTTKTVSLTPGGTAYALPVISFTVNSSAAGQTITFSTNNAVANPLTFAVTFPATPDPSGTYVIDSGAGTFVKSGSPDVDKLSLVTGDFQKLSPGAIDLTVALSLADIITAASVQWTRRWRTGD